MVSRDQAMTNPVASGVRMSDETAREMSSGPGASRHRQLAVILVLFVCLATVYSLVLPLGEAADETDHFALVRFIAEHGRLPLTIEEREAIGPKGDASPLYHGLVVLLTQHVDVSALPELPETQARPERFIPTDGFRSNRILHTEDEAFPFRGIVLAWHLARLVSVPLGAATVLAAYCTALSIYPQRRYLAAGAAAFVAFLPRFLISSAVVNDDSLVVPLVAWSVYYLVRVAQGDQNRGTLVRLGVLMGLAAIVKYHSLLLVPEMTLLMILLAWRASCRTAVRGEVWRAWLRRWAWVMLAFALVAGWWFVFLVVRFNQVTELGWVRGLMAPLGDPVVTSGFGRVLEAEPGGTPDYEFGWSDWASLSFRSFWLTYAWLHIFAPAWIYLVLGVFTLLSALGIFRLVLQSIAPPIARLLGRARAVSGTVWQPGIGLLALHLLVYLGVMVMRYWLKPARETGQGRHLYPAITAIAFFFVLGLSNIPALIGRARMRARGPTVAAVDHSRVQRDAVVAPGFAAVLLAVSVAALPLIIMPEYVPFLPVRSAGAAEVPIPHREAVRFEKGLEFVGFQIPENGAHISGGDAGDGLPVTLYWYAGARLQRDYLVQICLLDPGGQQVLCHYGHPVDGRYPMRAWETGYLVRDRIILPVPDCVPAGEYELTMTLVPLRLDTAATMIDATARQRSPVSLGQVSLTTDSGGEPPDPSVELWTAGKRVRQGSIELTQMRQSLTAITYREASGDPPDGAAAVSFVRGGEVPASWDPSAPVTSYRCPTGVTADVRSFVLDPGVQPGRYDLSLDGQAHGDLSVQVETRWREYSPPAGVLRRLDATFAPAEAAESVPYLSLLGYDVDPSARWPGDTILLTGCWQSLRTMSRHYVVSLYLVDSLMRVAGQADWTLGGHYPSVLWAPGETVNETYSLAINPQAPAGLYTIELSLYDYVLPDVPPVATAGSRQAGTVSFLLATVPPSPDHNSPASQAPTEHLFLQQLRVRDPAERTPPSHALSVGLGGQIQLIGYDLPVIASDSPSGHMEPGRSLNLILRWQATQQPTDDYTVFTQLVGPDGLVWGQQDNQPQQGRYPTTLWTVGQQVVDRYEVPLRPDAPPGQYRLLAGMYRLATGQRLAAVGADGARTPDDAVPIATLVVE